MTRPAIPAVKITPDGTATNITLTADSDSGTLHALYREIGCRTVDVIRPVRDVDVWVDDEALLAEEPQLNPVASLVALRFGTAGINLVGTAVVTAKADTKGNVQPMHAELRDRVHDYARDARYQIATMLINRAMGN